MCRSTLSGLRSTTFWKPPVRAARSTGAGLVVAVLVVVWLSALLVVGLKRLPDWRARASIAGYGRRALLLRGFSAPGSPIRPTVARGPGRGRAHLSPAARARLERARRARERELVARRRRVLGALCASVGGSFVLGAIPPLRPLWYVSLASLLLALGYVGLLAWWRQQLAAARALTERAEKVVQLRPAGARSATSGAARDESSRPSPLPPARPAFVVLDMHG